MWWGILVYGTIAVVTIGTIFLVKAVQYIYEQIKDKNYLEVSTDITFFLLIVGVIMSFFAVGVWPIAWICYKECPQDCTLFYRIESLIAIIMTITTMFLYIIHKILMKKLENRQPNDPYGLYGSRLQEASQNKF